MAKKTGGRRASAHSKVTALWLDHLRVLFFSLGKLYRAPVASLITMLVIGIALALPTGVYLLLLNFQSLTHGWEDAAQISLFLKTDAPAAQIEQLATDVIARDDIESVDVVTAAEALTEFRETSGFGEALDTLGENPLPPVLIVMPLPDYRHGEKLQQLVSTLGGLEAVDLAQLDLDWLRRLQALMAFVHRGMLALAVMLGVAVLLVVGNTIRLDILNRREEIEVVKLIGGTDAFIRRPFLYAGLWYGLIGGIIAWLMINATLWLLKSPAEQLAGLYGSVYELIGLSATDSLLLLCAATGLGLLGSWLAVGRHLRRIQPS